MADEPRYPLELFIKKSGCYLCQRVHMIVLLKNLIETNACKVVQVDEKQKLKTLNDLNVGSTMLPVLRHYEIEYEDGEEIEAHLEKDFTITKDGPNYAGYEWPSLKSDDEKVKKLTEQRSPISDFNKWIRTDKPDQSKTYAGNLATFLRDADNILGENSGVGKGKYLTGDELKFPDCILLPKLYHMREVGKHITKDKGDILKGYPNVERYLKSAESKGTAFEKTRKSIDTIKWDPFKSKSKNSKDIAAK